MKRTCGSVIAFLAVLSAVAPAQNQLGTGGNVPVPPLAKGGIIGLWYREHEFIQKQYGEFELLNFDKVDYRLKKDGITDTTWQLTAIGNFLREGIQYATLARPNSRLDGTLLIMFEWADPADTTRPHGVFYHSVLSKDQLLIRTRQAVGGRLDTLEFSCADAKRSCGKLYLDTRSNQIVLKIAGQD